MQYWTPDVDKAIAQYKRARTKRRKEQLFNSVIYPTFCKMAECVFRKQNIQYKETSEASSISDLVTKMTLAIDKYDPKKKGFSFFNIVATRACWDNCNKVYQNAIKHESFDKPIGFDNSIHENGYNRIETAYNDPCDEVEAFQQELYEYWTENITNHMFTTEELAVARAILELIKTGGTDGTSTRFCAFYVRDITGIRLAIVQSVLNRMKKMNQQLLKQWYQEGTLKEAI